MLANGVASQHEQDAQQHHAGSRENPIDEMGPAFRPRLRRWDVVGIGRRA